jgi:hypothetical protein
VTCIKYGREGATDREAVDKMVLELVINDAFQVACDNHFVLTIFLVIVKRRLLIRMTRVKKRESVSWYGTGNELLDFTNHVGTGWLQVIGDARIVLENDNIFWCVFVGVNEELPEVVNINMRAHQRRPYWVCAAIVCDTNEKCSSLWYWDMIFDLTRSLWCWDMSFAFFFGAGRFRMRSLWRWDMRFAFFFGAGRFRMRSLWRWDMRFTFFFSARRLMRSLWCWDMSSAFSFFGIAERLMIAGTTGPAPARPPFDPPGPESAPATVKGTEENTHS